MLQELGSSAVRLSLQMEHLGAKWIEARGAVLNGRSRAFCSIVQNTDQSQEVG